MPSYGRSRNPFVPKEVKARYSGSRSQNPLADLIDTTDPAWPTTAAILLEMKHAGVTITEVIVEAAVKVAAYRHATAADPSRPPVHTGSYQGTLASTGGSIVYYIRRGHLIKIGVTVNPANRFKSLMPEEILAIEPGMIELESARKRQFLHLKCKGEYFRAAPELIEHAREIRRLHGDPDPSWMTVTVPASEHGRLPAPLTCQDTLTAAEASRYFGIPASTVYRWARHGLITPAEVIGGRGGKLYRIDQLAALIEPMTGRVRKPETK